MHAYAPTSLPFPKTYLDAINERACEKAGHSTYMRVNSDGNPEIIPGLVRHDLSRRPVFYAATGLFRRNRVTGLDQRNHIWITISCLANGFRYLQG